MSITKSLMVTAASLGLFAAVPATAAVNLVTNGNLEAGDSSGFLTTGNVGVYATPYFGLSDSTYGNYLLAFNGGNSVPNGVVSQNIATVTGQAYNFAFNYGVTSNGGQSILASVLDSLGNTIASQTFFTSSTSPSTASFNFVALSGGSTIQFADLGTNNSVNQDIAVDNISVAAVPEPATWAMMLMGFGMIGAGVRSRRKPTVRLTYV